MSVAGPLTDQDRTNAALPPAQESMENAALKDYAEPLRGLISPLLHLSGVSHATSRSSRSRAAAGNCATFGNVRRGRWTSECCPRTCSVLVGRRPCAPSPLNCED